MVECSSERELRGIARYDEALITPGAGLQDLMPDGSLALTVDPRQGKRYPGHRRAGWRRPVGKPFQLLCDVRAAGHAFLAQGRRPSCSRPTDPEERDANWEHVITLASTLTAEEMLSLDNPTILHRLYHEDPVRLFDIQPICFRCSCSRERSANALVSLGLEDAQQLVIEHNGSIEIDCQFCNERYLFDATDVAQLFAGGGVDSPSDTRH